MSNRYTGQVLDDEVGLYYYNARYYDPEISRFVQADSVLPDLSSQCLNRYSYCINNPLIYTDPSGNDFGLSALIASAIIGAIAGAAAGATVSAIAGGNIWQGMLNGAIGGAIGGSFGYIGGLAGWMGAAAVNPWVSADGQRMYYSEKRGVDNTYWLCMARWDEGAGVWVPEKLFSELHVMGYSDSDMCLSLDELTMYYGSDRPGGKGAQDIWKASRPTMDDLFSAPVSVAEVNTSRYDHHPFLSHDGLTLYFSSEDDPIGWNVIIYEAHRSVIGEPFGDIQPVEQVDTDVSDYCPFESWNGRAFLYSTDEGIYEILAQSVPMD